MKRCVGVILSAFPIAVCFAQPDAQPDGQAELSLVDAAAEPAAEPAAEQVAEPPRRYGFFSGTYTRAPRPYWHTEIEANVWYASPGGDVSIGGTQLTGTDGFNLDSPRATPMVEAHLRYDPWNLSFRGSLLDVGSTAFIGEPTTLGPATFAAGDAVTSGYRLDEFALRAGYRFYQFDADASARGRPLFSVGVDAMAGLRVYDGTFAVAGPGGSAGASFTHIEPLVGFTTDITFADRYEIQIQNTYGGSPTIDDRSSFTFDLQATFKYRPIDNAAIQLGYRIRRNVLVGSDYELDGAVAGVFAGLTLRF